MKVKVMALASNINRGRKVTGKFSFACGVHPPHRKSFSEGVGIREIAVKPGQVFVLPMVQHIGAPCKPVVEVKAEVSVGDLLGESASFVSAAVYSPVNGVVKQVVAMPHPSGRKVLSVVIEAGEEQPEQQQWREMPGDFSVRDYDAQAVVDAVRKAGIVGHGGAAFPTAVKLTANPKKPVDTIILNGCECEPYLTSDHRLMLESPGPIAAGLQLAMKATGAQRGIIAIEDNKPDAVSSMLDAIRDIPNVQLAVCKTKYPQGGEKQLINAVLGRVVPTGGLPLDAGVVVVNVGTAAAMAWACAEGRPLTERIVTVTGAGVNKPGNFRVPIGMLLSDLLDEAGGLRDDAEKVLLGGPMMGPATVRFDIPILKGTSGITVMTSAEVLREAQSPCIRCSRCVDHCPLKLMPTKIAHAVKARDLEAALGYDLMACVECGCCSYVCPAHIPLVQYMRSGKLMVRNLKN